MLPDVLEHAVPEILERAGAQPDAAGVLHALIAALRAGRGDPPAVAWSGGADTLRALEQCVFAVIDERAPATRPGELWPVARWFGALAQRALEDENRRLVAMLDAVPDHLLLLDTDMRVLYLNRASAEYASVLWARPSDQLIGVAATDALLPDWHKRYFQDQAARALQGETIRDRFMLPLPGGPRWREHWIVPVRDCEENIAAVAIASRDVHARQQAEARLQLLSKIGTLAEAGGRDGMLARTAQLVIPELADWAIVDLVADGRVRSTSVAHGDPERAERARQLLCDAGAGPRASAAELAGRVVAIDDPVLQDRDPALHQVMRQLGATTAIVVPFVVLGAPVAVATFVFGQESGREHGADDLAIADEVARRVAQVVENARLHEQLRKSDARFRVALQGSNIVVFEEDRELRLQWSYNAPQLRSDDAAPGVLGGEFLPPQVADDLRDVKRRVLATGEGARASVDAVIGGERRKLLIGYEPLRHQHEIVGLTGAAVDVTELTRVQQDLAEELAFRERVIGVLGHDLRNPLSAVLSLAAVLERRDGIPERTKEGLRHIHRSALRMERMIATILDFTQFRFRGAPSLALEPFDLEVLARAIVDELRVAHPDRTIEVDADGELRGRWDHARLGQVISNLVGNALTHGAREAAVDVRLSAEPRDVYLAVSNRGPTIPPGTLPRLFEPFWQGPTIGTSHPRGLGLGLFIVQQVVQAHGGAIDVRSADDVTTFTVRLPRSDG